MEEYVETVAEIQNSKAVTLLAYFNHAVHVLGSVDSSIAHQVSVRVIKVIIH